MARAYSELSAAQRRRASVREGYEIVWTTLRSEAASILRLRGPQDRGRWLSEAIEAAHALECDGVRYRVGRELRSGRVRYLGRGLSDSETRELLERGRGAARCWRETDGVEVELVAGAWLPVPAERALVRRAYRPRRGTEARAVLDAPAPLSAAERLLLGDDESPV